MVLYFKKNQRNFRGFRDYDLQSIKWSSWKIHIEMQLFIQWFYEEKSVDPQQAAEWLENLQLIPESNATKHIFKVYGCGLFLGTFIIMLISNTYSGKYSGKQINLFWWRDASCTIGELPLRKKMKKEKRKLLFLWIMQCFILQIWNWVMWKLFSFLLTCLHNFKIVTFRSRIYEMF